MKIIIFVLLITIVFKNLAWSQDTSKKEIIVSLDRRAGLKPFSGGTRSTHLEREINGYIIDTTRYTKWLLKYISFDPYQDAYDRYRRGEFSKDSIDNYLKFYKVSQDRISNLLYDHRIYFLIGSLKNGDVELIIDNNRNKNFNDEKIIVYKNTEKSVNSFDKEDTTMLPIMKVNYEYRDGLNINKTSSIIQPIVYKYGVSFDTYIENQLPLFINSYEHMIGKFNYDGTWYIIKLSTYFGIAEYTKETTEIIIDKLNEKSESINVILNNIGDSIQIDSTVFYLDKLSYRGDTISIIAKNIKHQIQGNYIGYISPYFSTKDINFNDFNLSDNRGNYLLLDFWGTWCGPCIAQTPDLRNIYDKYNEKKFDIVSIASNSKRNNIINHINKYGLRWKQIDDNNISSGKTITDLYKIDTFPTYILVSPDGHIVLRTNSIQRLSHYLEEISW